MKKSEILTLLFLDHQKLDNLKSMNDYVEQFEVTEKQFQAILDSREEEN